MPQFTYIVSSKGEESTGILEAKNLAEAAEKLQEKGGYILELKQRFSLGSLNLSESLESMIAPFSQRLGTSEKILFTSQLGSMLKTGLPITEAIDAFIDESGGGASVVFTRIIDQLKRGQKFSDALESFPKIFDSVYVNVVRSGETTGTLADSLTYLGNQLKREHSLKGRVKSALIYPIVVFIAMIAVMTFIALSVVPKIVTFAETSGAKLPKITELMIAGTLFIQRFWPILLITLLSLGVGSWTFFNSKEGKKIVDKIILKIPVLGTLIRRYNQIRFARLLAGFYKYGISVESAFDILSQSLGNYYYSQACIRLKQRLVLGRSLSVALSAEKELFPPIMARVVKGAERTGVLDETLLKFAVFYERELERDLKNLTSLIEPIMIVFLGVGVIGIALSVIVPIYRVTSQIR